MSAFEEAGFTEVCITHRYDCFDATSKERTALRHWGEPLGDPELARNPRGLPAPRSCGFADGPASAFCEQLVRLKPDTTELGDKTSRVAPVAGGRERAPARARRRF